MVVYPLKEAAMTGKQRNAIGLIIIMTSGIFFASGCETAGALRRGDVQMKDVVMMAKLDTPPRKCGANCKPATSRPDVDFSKADSWIRRNLW
jgi:hypothetical protein